MAPKRKVSDSDVDTLIAEVSSETEIWCTDNPNHGNGYLIKKAWERIAAKMGYTVAAVQSKWLELCSEKCIEQRETPKLTSGSAGSHSGKEGMPVRIQQLGFLKDKKSPVAATSGNMDTLVEKSALVAPSSSLAPQKVKEKIAASVDEIPSIPSGQLKLTDEQFFSSLLPTIEHLSDEEKLDFRIDVMDVLEFVKERTSTINDDEEIEFLGEWIPNSASVGNKPYPVKKEKNF